jgi:hypothetical protein
LEVSRLSVIVDGRGEPSPTSTAHQRLFGRVDHHLLDCHPSTALLT